MPGVSPGNATSQIAPLLGASLRRGVLGVKTEQAVRANRWRVFQHIRWDGKEEIRYIREIIYGKRRTIQYWQITTDKETVPDDSTWFVMTKIPNLKYKEVGEIYKIRAQVEQGFRNSKNELGWADFRLTNYADIQKWWELVMCAYLMVCLHNVSFNPSVNSVPEPYQQHSLWDSGTGWKSAPPALRFPQRIGRSKQCLK